MYEWHNSQDLNISIMFYFKYALFQFRNNSKQQIRSTVGTAGTVSSYF